MRDFLASTRRCATCQWWAAPRLANLETGRVLTVRHGLSGCCLSKESWWQGRYKPAESVCRFWQPWERVRGVEHSRSRLTPVMLEPRTDEEPE